MKDDESLLDCMMIDAAAQKSIYRPDKYWLGSAETTASGLRRHGISHFRSDPRATPGGSFNDAPKLDPREAWVSGKRGALLRPLVDNRFIKKHVLNKYVSVIESLYDETLVYKTQYLEANLGSWFEDFVATYGLPDTLVGDCKAAVTLRGRKVSISYLDFILRITTFQPHADFSRVNSLFVIGGGFGYEAHLLMHMFPNIKKCLYLDIPPMLYIATQYLKHFFGPGVRDYRELREKQQLAFSPDDSQEILAIPPWMIERFEGSIDLFWNSCSFQEIPKSTRAHYASFVNRFSSVAPSAQICLIIYPWESPLKGGSNVASILDDFEGSFQVEEIRPDEDRRVYVDHPLNRFFYGKR